MMILSIISVIGIYVGMSVVFYVTIIEANRTRKLALALGFAAYATGKIIAMVACVVALCYIPALIRIMAG